MKALVKFSLFLLLLMPVAAHAEDATKATATLHKATKAATSTPTLGATPEALAKTVAPTAPPVSSAADIAERQKEMEAQREEMQKKHAGLADERAKMIEYCRAAKTPSEYAKCKEMDQNLQKDVESANSDMQGSMAGAAHKTKESFIDKWKKKLED